jgi:hypothetical protein
MCPTLEDEGQVSLDISYYSIQVQNLGTKKLKLKKKILVNTFITHKDVGYTRTSQVVHHRGILDVLTFGHVGLDDEYTSTV